MSCYPLSVYCTLLQFTLVAVVPPHTHATLYFHSVSLFQRFSYHVQQALSLFRAFTSWLSSRWESSGSAPALLTALWLTRSHPRAGALHRTGTVGEHDPGPSLSYYILVLSPLSYHPPTHIALSSSSMSSFDPDYLRRPTLFF